MGRDETDKVKIPCWDGDITTFDQFAEDTFWYVEGTDVSKRYLCGPRIAARLTNDAETALGTRKRKTGWLSRSDGAFKLLDFLKTRVAKQALPDVGDRLEAFFFRLRHRKGESMASWIYRSKTAYNRLQKSLQRVIDNDNTGEVEPKVREFTRELHRQISEPICDDWDQQEVDQIFNDLTQWTQYYNASTGKGWYLRYKNWFYYVLLTF